MNARVAQSADGMTKARQHRIERLADEVDRVLEGDRRTRRRLDRQHRVRLAARAEIELNNLVVGRHAEPPPGCSHFVAVKQLAPGVRTRVFLFATSDASTDVAESVARAIFDNTFKNTGSILDEEGRAL